MSKAPLQTVDPVKAAEKGRVVEGEIPLCQMPRVGDMLADTSGQVKFRLQFGREGGFCAVRGSVRAKLTLECQCCLSPLEHAVAAEVALGVVSSLEQVQALPETLEPLLAGDDGMLSVLDVVEDELILAIPPVPRHAVCVARDEPFPAQPGAGEKSGRPFASLSALIKLDQQQ